jgi:hypothetical protein
MTIDAKSYFKEWLVQRNNLNAQESTTRNIPRKTTSSTLSQLITDVDE